jgi:hypothetical protein
MYKRRNVRHRTTDNAESIYAQKNNQPQTSLLVRLQNDAPTASRAVLVVVSSRCALNALSVFLVDDVLRLDGHVDDVGGFAVEATVCQRSVLGYMGTVQALLTFQLGLIVQHATERYQTY